MAWSACNEGSISLRGDWGSADFKIEIADDDAERAQGLMFRTSMARFSGMLFIYPEPVRARFWMKNTLIPLDMLFVDVQGVVKKIHHRAEPESQKTIIGGVGVFAVLELNGGVAEMLGMGEGTELRHSAFGETAAWPCE